MNIPNYYSYSPMLSSGAQPQPDHFALLQESGFEVIINLSPSSTRNALKDESSIAEQLKMDYVHFPVDCSNLRPIHYRMFKEIMNGAAGKKVFVHCGGNIKSSNLLHMYHVLEKGMDETESLKTLKQIQQPEKKWFRYFRSMGMKGMEVAV